MGDTINLDEVMTEMERRKKIYNRDKARNKILKTMEWFGLDKNVFRDMKKSKGTCIEKKPYCFPASSLEFLVSLNENYISSDMKNVRKGRMYDADTKNILKIVKGFEEMLNEMDIDDQVRKEQIDHMYSTVMPNYLLKVKELKAVLDDIWNEYDYKIDSLDLAWDEESYSIEDMEKDPYNAPTKEKKYKFYEILDGITEEDYCAFLDLVLSDYQELQVYHKRIYDSLLEVRQEELSDIIEREAENLSREDIERERNDIERILKNHKELLEGNRFNEYVRLQREKNKLLRAGSFVENIKKKDKEIWRIYSQASSDLTLKPEKDTEGYVGIKYEKSSEEALKEAISNCLSEMYDV